MRPHRSNTRENAQEGEMEQEGSTMRSPSNWGQRREHQMGLKRKSEEDDKAPRNTPRILDLRDLNISMLEVVRIPRVSGGPN
jgi:hypothetical protein